MKIPKVLYIDIMIFRLLFISLIAINISSNLRDKGYFIGTCFDGHTVFKALSEIEQGTQLVGKYDGNIQWKIRKDYNEQL